MFISVSLGQRCGLKTHTDKWVLCLKEGAFCCITVGNLGHKLYSPSILPVEVNIGRNRWAESIYTWLYGWCHCQPFGVCDNAMACAAAGMLA